MKKFKDIRIPFPPPGQGFGGLICGQTAYDPLGSYTGNVPERDEFPVQDADDL